MTETVSLFVYGSFTENRVHFPLIANFVKAKKPAAVEAHVFRLEVGYPVLAEPSVPVGQPTSWVRGELLEVEADAVLFRLLDEFHGYSAIAPEKSLFFKVEMPFRTEAGELGKATCYVINPSKLPKTARWIPQGDWQAALDERPALSEQLTEPQRSYVCKLGASTGRDIVPIDLELYRQLMKLELIVDKGRRLALTRLGKEVYRYLPK
ncbi:MAG: gamma-glutamylcyclotransferase [Pseudobdellovibrionaceae bacterium]|nr:gamma-glutamylcyclotransferase [Bdellovibrionales bacterium]USN46645.1 MAG: gamma-glutamylcyclotransferase [Pseudobdellovibrionaceae bacterium]